MEAAGYASSTYMMFVRRLSPSILTAGDAFTCLLSGGQIVCWGVRNMERMDWDERKNRDQKKKQINLILFILFLSKTPKASLGRTIF